MMDVVVPGGRRRGESLTRRAGVLGARGGWSSSIEALGLVLGISRVKGKAGRLLGRERARDLVHGEIEEGVSNGKRVKLIGVLYPRVTADERERLRGSSAGLTVAPRIGRHRPPNPCRPSVCTFWPNIQ